MSSNKLPQFLVIGAAKSGTTSLHEYLRQHPKISLPVRKETHFFICDRESNPIATDYMGRILENPIDNIDDYQVEFEKKQEPCVYGEVCPSYLFYPNAAENIKKYIPDAKIICILRNPVDRFFSNSIYRQNRKTGVEDIKGIMQSIRNNSADIHTRRSLEIGFYYKLLTKYYAIFPHENIKIFLFEELEKQPQKLMAEFMDFIGLPGFAFEVDKKFNRSGQSRLGWLYKRLTGSKLVKWFRKQLPRREYQWIRVRAERILLKTSGSMNEQDRKLLQKIFREDTIKLQDLIQRDLTSWLV